MKKIFGIIFLLILVYDTYGQDDYVPWKHNTECCPVVLDNGEGKYPGKLDVDGVIDDISPGRSCGDVCGYGTVKVKLFRRTKQYGEDFVFIVIPCLAVWKERFIGRHVHFRVKLLSEQDGKKDCRYHGGLNSIDSKGIPFYRPISEQYRPYFAD